MSLYTLHMQRAESRIKEIEKQVGDHLRSDLPRLWKVGVKAKVIDPLQFDPRKDELVNRLITAALMNFVRGRIGNGGAT